MCDKTSIQGIGNQKRMSKNHVGKGSFIRAGMFIGILSLIMILLLINPVNAYPPDDSHSKAFLYMNGTVNSTTFIDETGKVWTNTVNAQIVSSPQHFNNVGDFRSGTGDYLTGFASPDFNFTGKDMTIDLWYHYNTVSGATYPTIYSQHGDDYIQIYFNSVYTSISFEITGHYKTWTYPTLFGWHHLAFVKYGDSLTFYFDGVSKGSDTGWLDYIVGGDDQIPMIGGMGTTKPSNGYFDMVRVSDIARWTTDFSLPSEYQYIPVIPPTVYYFNDSSSPYHLDDLVNITDKSDCYNCLSRKWNITGIEGAAIGYKNINYGLSLTKYFPTWGKYNFNLSVTNSSGTSFNNSFDVTILNITPDSDYIGVPLTGTRPLLVDFTDLSTGNITSWDWNFGDANSSSLQSPSNLYSQSGSFDVSMEVCNPDECNDNLQISYIIVSDPIPPTTTPPTTTPTTPPTTTPTTEIPTTTPTPVIIPLWANLSVVEKGTTYIIWSYNIAYNITNVTINGLQINSLPFDGLIDKTGLNPDTSYIITISNNESFSSLITKTDKESMANIINFLDKIKFELLGIALIIIAILLSPFFGIIAFIICLIDGSIFIGNNEPIYGILAYFIAMAGILVFKFRGEK